MNRLTDDEVESRLRLVVDQIVALEADGSFHSVADPVGPAVDIDIAVIVVEKERKLVVQIDGPRFLVDPVPCRLECRGTDVGPENGDGRLVDFRGSSWASIDTEYGSRPSAQAALQTRTLSPVSESRRRIVRIPAQTSGLRKNPVTLMLSASRSASCSSDRSEAFRSTSRSCRSGCAAFERKRGDRDSCRCSGSSRTPVRPRRIRRVVNASSLATASSSSASEPVPAAPLAVVSVLPPPSPITAPSLRCRRPRS